MCSNRHSPSPISLVALDLDGTLLGAHYEISDVNKEALQEVQERGVHVVLVTGRSFAAARPFALELGLDEVPLVSHNGALVKLARSCELIHCGYLPVEVALASLEIARDFDVRTSLGDEPQGLGRVVLEREPTGRLLKFLEKSGAPYLVTPSLQVHLEELQTRERLPMQVTFSGPCRQVDAIENRLQAQLPGRFRFLKTAYRERDFTVGDLLCVECSKGTGLSKVVDHLGVEVTQVLAMGDNHNDLDMLRYASRAVLMGNADPTLREPGFFVTGTNLEHGVAQALRRWVLAVVGEAPDRPD